MDRDDKKQYFRVNFILMQQLFIDKAAEYVKNLFDVVKAYKKHLELDTEKTAEYAKELLGRNKNGI
jgi:hypothetical protein